MSRVAYRVESPTFNESDFNTLPKNQRFKICVNKKPLGLRMKIEQNRLVVSEVISNSARRHGVKEGQVVLKAGDQVFGKVAQADLDVILHNFFAEAEVPYNLYLTKLPVNSGTHIVEMTNFTPKQTRGQEVALHHRGSSHAQPDDCDAELCGAYFKIIVGCVGIIVIIILVATSSGGGGGYSGSGGSCFPEGTQIVLEDGSTAPIENLRIGSRILDGGVVQATMQFAGEPLYLVDGVAVAGDHTVFDSDSERWLKVRDFGTASELETPDVLFDLITENHRIVVQSPSTSTNVLFADYAEIDWSETIENHELCMLNSGNSWLHAKVCTFFA